MAEDEEPRFRAAVTVGAPECSAASPRNHRWRNGADGAFVSVVGRSFFLHGHCPTAPIHFWGGAIVAYVTAAIFLVRAKSPRCQTSSWLATTEFHRAIIAASISATDPNGRLEIFRTLWSPRWVSAVKKMVITRREAAALNACWPFGPYGRRAPDRARRGC
jgi:hypothetical protein